MIEFLKGISWSSAAGIVFGAAISALVAYLLQRNSFAEARKQKDADRKEVRKALGLSLMFKMVKVCSELQNLGNAVQECFERARKDNFKGMPFQIVMPIVPLPDPIHFSPDEMALILSIDHNLFNEMAALDELHNNTVGLFDLYNTKRGQLLDQLGAEMTGNIGATSLSQDQRKWFEPQAVQLNGLVEAMKQRTKRDATEAWAALEKLQRLLSEEFSMSLNLERKPPK